MNEYVAGEREREESSARYSFCLVLSCPVSSRLVSVSHQYRIIIILRTKDAKVGIQITSPGELKKFFGEFLAGGSFLLAQ